MNNWVVLASGASLTSLDVDKLRGKVNVCCVNNTFSLAPWAQVLFASDMAWWRIYHEYTRPFQGEKITLDNWKCNYADVESVNGLAGYKIVPFCRCNNSGAAAISFIHSNYQVDNMALLGFDMHGEHFFGQHPVGLGNSKPFKRFLDCLNTLAKCPEAKKITNCTKGSHLKSFKTSDIDSWLKKHSA